MQVKVVLSWIIEEIEKEVEQIWTSAYKSV